MLNLRPSCRQGKAERQRVPSQQLGNPALEAAVLIWGSQGDLFSSGRENRKIIEYILHTKEAGIFKFMCTAACTSEELQLTDVFFPKIV